MSSIDIDELFDEADTGKGKGRAKEEPISPSRRKASQRSPARPRADSEDSDILPPPVSSSMKPAKPKHGRLISNQTPLEDFNRLIEGEGDVFRKAIQDMAAVVKENVQASFSRQAFPLAMECLKAMRQTALTYEEVETYNE
jgi:ATP-dependent DNA helicase 2 subunit 2